MVTYYVTLFVSLLINYLTHHHFCLCGIYVTTYVTPTMTSLTTSISLFIKYMPHKQSCIGVCDVTPKFLPTVTSLKNAVIINTTLDRIMHLNQTDLLRHVRQVEVTLTSHHAAGMNASGILLLFYTEKAHFIFFFVLQKKMFSLSVTEFELWAAKTNVAGTFCKVERGTGQQGHSQAGDGDAAARLASMKKKKKKMQYTCRTGSNQNKT